MSSTTTTSHSDGTLRPEKFGVVHQFRVFCLLRPRGMYALLRDSIYAFASDNIATHGAALAYYTLFSVAPVLIVVAGVVGLVYGRSAAEGQLAPWLAQFLGPEGARAAQMMLAHAASPTGGIISTITGLVSLFFGASAVVTQLRQSMNAVWHIHVPDEDTSFIGSLKSLFSDRLYSFGVVIGAGILIVVSVVLNTLVAAAGTYAKAWLPLPEFVLHTINFLLSFGIITFMFTLVYKWLPDAYVAWGDAFVGAMVTALLFNFGGQAISAFIGKFAGSVYGTAGSVLAMLVWVFYSAQVFFFGAEVTRIFAERCGAGIVPVRHTLRSVVRRPSPAH